MINVFQCDIVLLPTKHSSVPIHSILRYKLIRRFLINKSVEIAQSQLNLAFDLNFW